MTSARFWTLTLGCWLLAVSTVSAQTRKPAQQKARTSTTQQKQQTKSAGKSTTGKSKTTTKTQKPKAKPVPQPTVKGLQSQRQQLQKQLKEQEQRLQANRKNVKQRLQNLQIINTEIADKQRVIDTIRQDIVILDDNIVALDIQLKNLEERLQQRKDNYMKSMRYMRRNRSFQNQLMFIFSAQNFTQMYRRLRFTREYAQYQRAQGEAVNIIKEEVRKGQEEMANSKRQKSDLLSRGEQERRSLEDKQAEQQKVVKSLQREQKTIESLISEQRKKDAALNAQIEKLIAEEIARAKARAEAEARAEAQRKAREAAEAAAKKRAEELARKKAAAEAAARENARRIAEAKAREEQAKQQALAAAKKNSAEKAAAERAARDAEKARLAAEQRAADEAKAYEREVAEAKKKEEEGRESVRKVEKADFSVSTEDRRLSGNFESNRGRLPMPITGNYRIVSGFGQNSVDGLKGVHLDNKGMNIKGQTGAQARSIFDGEVCAVFDIRGVMGVMVRHGSYISVYSNLSSVSVRRGQKVSTRQALGVISSEGILHFQLRKGSTAQNPARWLAR